MADERHQRIMEIFDEVCDLPPDEQTRVLDERCSGDPDLRRDVASMLAHDGSAGELFEEVERGRGVEAVAGDLLHEFEQASFTGEIGSYTVLREIGRGGMGVIYEAQQDSPRRRVALKVLQRGAVGEGVIGRFKREAHVLGQLQHPGIAQIHEAGVASTPYGDRPFFAMEFIDGLALDEHADDTELDVRQRLELIARVCDAVEYANQKGVVHRDLKPSNVLVLARREPGQTGTTVGPDVIGQPKVLDFGIARVADPGMHVTTIKTEAGQLVGTLAYMSPEQVAGGGDEIDARTDVFALGTIAYELVTGCPAHDVRGLAIPEAARVILDDEPTPVTVHDKSLAGDVATIIAKAIEKDPERRYPSAGALAADIRRHLANVPIEARPASTFYQLGKFARRNRGLVAGVAVAFVVLLLGVTGTTIGLVTALQTNARLDTVVADLSQANASLERVSRFQAEQFADVNAEVMGAGLRQAVLDAVADDGRATVDEQLARVNFTNIALRSLEQNVFERTLVAIDTEFQDDPMVRAELLQSAAVTLAHVGLLEAAIEPQRTAYELRLRTLGPGHPDTNASGAQWAELAWQLGDYERAESLRQGVLDWQRDTLGERHEDTIRSMIGMAGILRLAGDLDRAHRHSEDALERARSGMGTDHGVTIDTLSAHASVVLAQDRHTDAEPLLRESYELALLAYGPENDRTLSIAHDHALLLSELGRLDEAVMTARENLDVRRRQLGDDHPTTVTSLVLLATILGAQSRLAEAEELYRTALDQRTRALGAEHPDTLTAVNNLATSLDAQGRYQDAEVLYRSNLEARRRVQGNDHPSTLISAGNLGYVINAQGRTEEAEPFYREAVEGFRRVEGNDSFNTLQAVQNYAVLLSTLDRMNEAVPLYQESLEGRTRLLGEDHPATLNAIFNMGDLLKRQGKLDEAEPYCERSLKGYREVLGEDHIGTIYSLGLLGDLRFQQGRLDEAEELFREQLARRTALLGPDHPQTQHTTAMLADVLEAAGRADEANALRATLPEPEDEEGR